MLPLAPDRHSTDWPFAAPSTINCSKRSATRPIVEDLDHGYQSQLGEPGGAPHENIGVVGKAGNSSRFPPEHEDRMKYLLQLDGELYAFGADISRQLSLRGPLAQFAVEAKQKKKSCLGLSRNLSKHPLLAFDRNGVFDDTATTGSPLPPDVSSSLDWELRSVPHITKPSFIFGLCY